MAYSTDINSLLNEYKQQQNAEEARVSAVLNKLFEASSDFTKARKAYSAARTKEITAKLRGDKFEASKETKGYHKALKAACKVAGIDEDELKMRYACKECMDTGYIGETEKTYCNCLLNKVSDQMINSQNLNGEAIFEKFDIDIFPNNEAVDKDGRTQREHIIHQKGLALNWCDIFPNTKKLQMLVLGMTGVGKSFLVNCMAHEIVKKGDNVITATASGINEAMFSVINDKDYSMLRLFKSCALLIIDDLGVEPLINNITVETLYDIVEYRLANKKHTIICTNLSMVKIQERYGYRISSRLSSTKNTAVMRLLGKDLRK